ncbi:hypothetical protein PCASD_09939 [Puccinia coronata f. sp. avenae]|uniref:CCHC-type domain-containing protein n=1 Tax=Puccinia coronata f. sp. avenae TaxID=200324 RepID=A0A2N5UK76_9BASI|nr:hypothetical protein PCASD_09939 [Puccinia coronata f. sp. avenae]
MDMDAIQKQLADLMNIVKEEHTLQQQADAARAQAEAKLKSHELNPTTETAVRKGPKISVPNKCDGMCGAKAEVYASQIGLYVISNPGYFPDDRSKVVFSISYLTGQASTWAQPFTQRLFAGKDVTYESFLTAFQCMFFDTEKKNRAEKILRALKQTRLVAHYTHQFNMHAHDTGWEARTLVSQYTQGLKKDVQLALVLARTEFKSMEAVSNFTLKGDNEINGTSDPSPATNAPTNNPNAIDLSTFKGRLSEAERTRMMRAGLCFRCGKHGHLSHDCPDKKAHNTVRINELEEELRRLKDRNAKTDKGGKAEGELFAQKSKLIQCATASNQTISGFDGSTGQSSFEIDLTLNHDTKPSGFIITRLKDSYDGILGMPWVQHHGHLIDWKNRQFKGSQPSIAAAAAASSSPPRPSLGLLGNARMIDEGVCVFDTNAPPQCEHTIPPSPLTFEMAGKQAPSVELQEKPPARTAGLVATAKTVPSYPPDPSGYGQEPRRHAREIDGGVFASCTLALLQCEFDNPYSPNPLLAAGKPLSPLNLCSENPPEPWPKEGNARTDPGRIQDSAAAVAVSSYPTTPSAEGMQPRGPTRIVDEGVCASCTLALPQCECKTPNPTKVLVRTAGKPLCPVEQQNTTKISAAGVSCSKLA